METESELIVQALMERIGCRWKRIPHQNDQQTPDFLVEDGVTMYIIEVKEKKISDSIESEFWERLHRDEVCSMDTPLGPDKNIANSLRRGRRQVRSAVSPDDAYRLIWMHCLGLEAEQIYRNVLSTIYGKQWLAPRIGKWGLGEAKECYFFHHSAAGRLPEVVAFGVSSPTGAQLAINPFCEDVPEFKRTTIAEFFRTGDGSRSALIDPDEAASEDRIYLADCDVPRTPQRHVLNYLQRKYAVDTFVQFNPHSHTASSLVRT